MSRLWWTRAEFWYFPRCQESYSSSGLDLTENNSSLPPWPSGEPRLQRQRFFTQSVRHRLFFSGGNVMGFWFVLLTVSSAKETWAIARFSLYVKRLLSACVPPEKPSVSVSGLTLWQRIGYSWRNNCGYPVWFPAPHSHKRTYSQSLCALTPSLTNLPLFISTARRTSTPLRFNFNTLPLAFSVCNQCYLLW